MKNHNSPLGLYIHWPFCKAKCPYCDFNSHVRHNGVDQKEFIKAYLIEMKKNRDLSGKRPLHSIFFGGGTPSLMDVESVRLLLEEADKLWGIEQGAEITLEANPTSVESQRFQGYFDAGVNRISIGVQSLNDEALKWLGRQHSAIEAIKAIELARNIYDRVSFDLIYARQGLSLKDWEEELSQALQLHPDHISLYQLTYEKNTRFYELLKAGKHRELDEDIAADQYELTQTILAKQGLPAYEISNYAKKGEESRHNLLYWRYHDYIGIGAGAHGRITQNKTKKLATSTYLNPEKWHQEILQTGSPWQTYELLSKAEIADEMLVMGLRLVEGISHSWLKQISDHEIDLNALKPLIDEDYLIIKEDNIMISTKGRPLTNPIIAQISTAVSAL